MICDSERILVAAAKEGDSEAFGLLYLEHQRFVRYTCLRILKNQDLADEMAQEVFLQAWRKLSYFRGTCRFRTWLYRIAFNKSCYDLRGRGCRPEEVPFEEDIERTLGYRSNLDARGQVKLALAALKREDREIVVMFHLEGRSVHELMGLVGLSEPALKARLVRARAKMREAIA